MCLRGLVPATSIRQASYDKCEIKSTQGQGRLSNDVCEQTSAYSSHSVLTSHNPRQLKVCYNLFLNYKFWLVYIIVFKLVWTYLMCFLETLMLWIMVKHVFSFLEAMLLKTPQYLVLHCTLLKRSFQLLTHSVSRLIWEHTLKAKLFVFQYSITGRCVAF